MSSNKKLNWARLVEINQNQGINLDIFGYFIMLYKRNVVTLYNYRPHAYSTLNIPII